MRVYHEIRETFWAPQKMAMEAFENATTKQDDAPLTVTIDEAKPMRVIITCGCGKSRCLNCITLKYQRSCGLFMSIPLIYQFLNKEVFGGYLYMETDGELHPEWIDKDREVLVICSKEAKSVKDLTPQQSAALFQQQITLDDVAVKFTVTTDENKIYSFLKNVIRKNKKCIVLSTYHSAHKLKNVTDRLASGGECLFGLTFYDEAHTLFTASGKRDFLYKTNGSGDDDDQASVAISNDDDDDDVMDESDEDESDEDELQDSDDEFEFQESDDEAKVEKCWENLVYWGHRVFATATQSTRMLAQQRHLGDELINYSFGDAINDKIVRDYDLYIHLYRDAPKNGSRLETHLRIMAKAMKDCDRRRVLCFHSFANETEKNQGTSAKMAEKYKSVIAKELGVPLRKVWTCAVTGTMSEEQRTKIFNEFQNPPNDGIYRVLFNCKVVGTGIDLKCIDMISFIDPRKQPVVITQNIFRGVRKNTYDERHSAVFLPVMIEGGEIEGAPKEERNAMIKKQLHDSCYNQLAEFLHCLKQHDIRWEEIFAKNLETETTGSSLSKSGNEKQLLSIDASVVSNRMRDRILISNDSSIEWDISDEDLRNAALETVCLVGSGSESSNGQEKAQIAFDFIVKHYQNAPPVLTDNTQIPNYGNGFISVGNVYATAKTWKKKQNTAGIYGKLVRLLDKSNYKFWHKWCKFMGGQPEEEKAQIACNFLIENYGDNPPKLADSTFIPNYGDGTVQIGTLYAAAKQAKKKHNNVYVELVKILDASDYTFWHDWHRMDKDQNDEEKAQIAFEFIVENYENGAPKVKDTTCVPNYGHGRVRVGNLYKETKKAKRTQKQDGVHGKLVALFDASDYKFWHADTHMSYKEKAKIIFDFIIENYQNGPPKPSETIIPNYCNGSVNVYNSYHHAKEAKKKKKFTGVHGELAKMFDASNYKHWFETKQSKAQIIFDFVVNNFQDAPPTQTNTFCIPNYRDGTIKIGGLYNRVKQAKRFGTTSGFVREMVNLFDASDYKFWDKNAVNKNKKAKAKIAFDFILENYPNAPPSSKDQTIIDYGTGPIRFFSVYAATKMAKKKGQKTGVYAELVKMLDTSYYKPWHDIFKNINEDDNEDDARHTKQTKRPRDDVDDDDDYDDDDDDDDARQTKRPRDEEEQEANGDEVEIYDDDEPDQGQPSPPKANKTCTHVWKEVKTDETHRYVVCELCERTSKQRRVAASRGYKESNPEKKATVNDWLARQKYIHGCAWVLDSHGMKTTRALTTAKRFRPDEIMVPEYDEDVFDENSKHEEFGSCLLRGDFLDNLKRAERDDISLIYADFTGRYETFVKPLFEFLENEKHLRPGAYVGVTWSNNGAGTQTERSKIYRDLGIFMHRNGFDPIDDPVVSESGYGDGGNMNIQFMIKK